MLRTGHAWGLHICLQEQAAGLRFSNDHKQEDMGVKTPNLSGSRVIYQEPTGSVGCRSLQHFVGMLVPGVARTLHITAHGHMAVPTNLREDSRSR